jgi:uncharacterized membrane protein HdeD (DUF308 family)
VPSNVKRTKDYRSRLSRHHDGERRRSNADSWWLFLVAGIAWIVFSLTALQFDLQSLTAIAYLAAFAFIVAGINEAMTALAVREWRWLHGVLGVILVVFGALVLLWPGRTFQVLTNLVAWFLLLKGTADVVLSIATRGHELWWVRLVAGLLSIGIAFWAAANAARSALLLVVWVGISCLTRGVTEILMSFQLRSLKLRLVSNGPSPQPLARRE